MFLSRLSGYDLDRGSVLQSISQPRAVETDSELLQHFVTSGYVPADSSSRLFCSIGVIFGKISLSEGKSQ